MAWEAIVNEATGRLVSVGTVIADPLPAGLVSISLPSRPPDVDMWDEATRGFIPRPVKVLADRLDDLDAMQPFRVAVQRRDRAAVLAIVGDLLGGERFRNQAEPVNIGGNSE